MEKIQLSQFSFSRDGYGVYKVKYETKRGDYWVARIEDMGLIDDTKNSEEPTQRAFRNLRNAVKWNGTHYSKNGENLDDQPVTICDEDRKSYQAEGIRTRVIERRELS